MKQIKVAITDETKAYLDDEARKSGRNLSEEVRSRMEQSQVDDRFDATTKELGRDVMWMANHVAAGARATAWTADRHLIERVRASIDTWLLDLANDLKLPELSEEAMQEARRLGAHNARAYADIKPMLIKHRPGGDNIPEENR